MGFITAVLLWLLFLIALIILVVAVSLVIYARWNYGTLEKMGIPVVKPHWFLGSNYNCHYIHNHTEDIVRSRKYGHVYGVYEGREPMVAVSDPKILRRILSTDFEHFRNHRNFAGEHPVFKEITDFLDDEKWKTVRATLTPHFTTGKIKHMCETIREISDEYVTALINDNKDEKRIKVDFRKYCPPLVLEIIGKCFCGIDIENARDPNNKFIETLKAAMGGDFFEFDWKFTVTAALPILQKLSPIFPNEALDKFETTMRGILKGREKSQIKKSDMVNTLLEMCKRAETDKDYKRLGITEITALGQAFEFFLASYEAVRSTLSLFTYNMATNPQIQEKLLSEIDSALKKHNGQINYESISELPYVSACLSETLRRNPGFFKLDRVCTQDWEYEDLKIKKNMVVLIPLYALHYNADYYKNPEEFNPERYMPGEKEKLDMYANGMFGNGPRACIGQRFVYEMLKIIVCHYMKEFTIEKRKDTVFNIVKGNPLLLQYDPILVDFVRRN